MKRRLSFRVFACAFPTEISSIFGKIFHFPFPYFVLFVLQYYPFHVVNLFINYLKDHRTLIECTLQKWPRGFKNNKLLVLLYVPLLLWKLHLLLSRYNLPHQPILSLILLVKKASGPTLYLYIHHLSLVAMLNLWLVWYSTFLSFLHSNVVFS